MIRSRRTTASAAVAGAAAIALIATGCSTATDPGAEGGEITLNVATFNDFGYTDELLAQFDSLDRLGPLGTGRLVEIDTTCEIDVVRLADQIVGGGRADRAIP